MNLLLLPLYAFIVLSYVQAYTFSGYGIKDLEGTTTATFQAEADSWTLSSSVSTAKITTTTSSTPVPILGGLSILGVGSSTTIYNQYFQRVYSNLPPHTFVGFTVVMWFFDSAWDTIVPVTFKFDSTTVYFTTVSYSADFTSFDGGIAAQKDLGLDHIKGAASHSGSTLTFQVISQGSATSATQSFGFRELNIHFSNYTSIPATCHISEQVNPLSSSQCDCTLNQGKDTSSVCQSCATGCSICFGSLITQCLACSSTTHWDGSSCNTCNAACKTCTGTTNKQCTQCSYGAYDYGNNTCSYSCPSPFVAGTTRDSNGVYTCSKPCTSTQWYWSANSSCLNYCNNPFEQYTDADGIVYCTNPCTSVNVNYYLYDNKSCLATCSTPLLAKFYTGVRLCSNPCDPSTQFLYTNRSCLTSCPTPLANRIEPGVKYCFSPCTISSYYLYNNGSCYASCTSPLISRSESGTKYCYTPCSSVNKYIFANGSCSTDCPSPLISRTETNVAKYCDNPCPTSYYVLQNSSCSASCYSPLVSRSEPNVKYCYNPCSDPTNYLYTNGTCKATCPSPLMSRSEPNTKYCWSPCAESSEYLYSDQSCSSSCSAPLKIRKNPGVNYCYTPCSEELYVNDDGTCTSTCEYPYKIVQNPLYKICTIDLNTLETEQAETLAQAADAANIVSFLGGLLTNIFTPGDPTSMLMWSMIKMIEFVKYTKVSFPAQMEQIFATQNDYYTTEGFMTSTGRRALQAFTDDIALGKFGYYEIPTRFIDNFWQQLIVLTILFFAALLTLAMSSGAVRSPKAQNRVQKAMEILKWNAILVVFCGTYGDLVLYSALEFQTVAFVNFISVFSFFICLAMVLFAIYVPIKVILVNRALMKSKNTAVVADSSSTTTVVYQSKEEEKKWQNYKVFFEVYKSESYSQQLFLLIYLLRVALFNIIIGYLYNAPLAQALLIFFLNAAMTTYLSLKAPIKKRLSHIQQMTIEVMLLVYNFCLLMLAIFDKTGIEAPGARAAFGGIMVVIILVGPLTVALIILFKLGLLIKEAYLRYKRKPNKEEFLQLNPRSVTGASVEGMQIRPARRVRGANEVSSNLEMSEMVHAIPNNRTFVEADSSMHMPHQNTRRLDSIMNHSGIDLGASQTERSAVEHQLRRSDASLASDRDNVGQHYYNGRNLRLEENNNQIRYSNSHHVQRFNNSSNSITRTQTQELSFTNNGVYNAHAALGIRLKRRLYNMSGTQLDTTNPAPK